MAAAEHCKGRDTRSVFTYGLMKRMDLAAFRYAISLCSSMLYGFHQTISS